jgi:transcriptional regulator with XRE-family HTH domain
MTVGERIKYYRERKGLSQEQLAELIGVTQENVSYMENDKVGITVEKLKRICDALDVTIADIVE